MGKRKGSRRQRSFTRYSPMPTFLESITGALTPAAPTTPLPTAQTSMFTPREDTLDVWDDYPLYGKGSVVPGPYTTPRVVGYGSYKAYTPKRILMLHEDGTKQPFTLTYNEEGWLPFARNVWPGTEHEVEIPKAHMAFTYGEPTFNACVYQAADNYMQARWGRKLDDSDRRWLAAHPFATDAGVPQEYTATCVNQLVEPYGMRVSRIRIRKGSLVLGDQIMGWLQALGCNPFAMADRTTSNVEAAAKLGMPLDAANLLWRVEFHDDPLPGSIIGERGWTNSTTTGVTTGAFGGHARYLAPRARAGDWFVSIQLDVDSQVTYLMDPPNPEYVARKGAPVLQVAQITGPDNTLIAIKSTSGKWHRPGEAPPPVTPTVTPTASSTNPYGSSSLAYPPAPVTGAATPPATATPYAASPGYATSAMPYATGVRGAESRSDARMPAGTNYRTNVTCLVCTSRGCEELELSPDADVCYTCLDAAWRGYYCPRCKDNFDGVSNPVPDSVQDDGFLWMCTACRETLVIGFDDTDSDILEVSIAMFGGLSTAQNDATGAADTWDS